MTRRVIKNRIGAAEEYLTRFYEYATYRDLWLLLLTAGFAVFLVYITPFAVVLREDAYNFAVKGMEIATGDFSLDRPQAIGWPMLLGVIYAVLSVDNIFEAMYVSRWTSVLCTALAAFALGKASGAMFPGREQKAISVMVVLAFVANSLVYSMARSAMSEALFVLCVIGVVYFSVHAIRRGTPNYRGLVIAAFMAAAAYYVRPNGLFVFAALLMAVSLCWWGSARSLWTALCVSIAVFAASLAPYLYARFVAFGSAFDYGPNSKYFVEDYEHVWADNIAAPSLWEFVTSHGIAGHYERFVDRGLLPVLNHTGGSLLEPPWALLALLGGVAVLVYRRRSAYIVPLSLAVSIAGMSMIFAIFGTVRHLFYFIPLLLLSAGGVFIVLQRYRLPLQSIVATAMIVLVVSDLPNVVWMGPEQRQLPQVQDHWAVWAANNIEGTVAIVEGGDFVKMSQHYEPTGWRVARSFEDVEPHIRVWRPGVYKDLDEALFQFRDKGVSYLISDRESMKRRPYLFEVSHPRWRKHFRHLGYYHLGGKGSKLHRVTIYQVLY